MKSERSLNSKMQLAQTSLDPLQINELIVQQKMFLPLIISENQQPKVYPLIFKIMRDRDMDKIIIYVLSEVDLYFLYKFQVSYETIVNLNNDHKLCLKKMADFVQFMKGSLDDIQNHEKQGFLQITNQNDIEFTLTRTVAGKNHIVMQIYGKPQSEELITAQVAYRYGALRERIFRKEQRIHSLKEMVKQKYPHLLKNFKQI